MTEIAVSQLPAALNLQIHAGNAVLLLGLPGIGKTQIAQQWLADHTDELVVLDGSQTPEELVQGVPFVAGTGIKGAQLSRELMSQMTDIKRLLTDTNQIVGLNLEELSSFSQADQRTVMNMVLAGQLPDGSVIDRERLVVIATANPSSFMDDRSDASVNDIENALFTRMAVYNVVPDVQSWLTYARQNGVHPAVIYALEETPTLFEDEAHRTVPRTLSFLSNVMHVADEFGLAVTVDDIAALIGDENAAQFKYVYDHVQQLVSLQAVVRDPEVREQFSALSDAEKSYVWLRGLPNISADYDVVLRELVEELPSDTLIASFKQNSIWSTDENLATTRYLAGAWKALENVE